jgi:hypothetical protein
MLSLAAFSSDKAPPHVFLKMSKDGAQATLEPHRLIDLQQAG